MKVIGIAGSDEKGQWLTKELSLDHFINYKNQDVATELQTIAPEGVDLYFDNVTYIKGVSVKSITKYISTSRWVVKSQQQY